MRTTIAIGTFLALGAGALSVGAVTPLDMRGSDTLKELTRDLLGNDTSNLLDCGGTGNNPVGGINYIGSGSGNAESSMAGTSPTQQVGPMSRLLKGPAAKGACNSADVTKNEGMVFALDGIAILANAGNFGVASCNGTISTSCVQDTTVGLARNRAVALSDGTTYTFSDWRDVLRVLYAGMSQPTTDNNLAHRNCGSVVRTSLADNWTKIFQGTCAGGNCSSVGDPGTGNNTASFRPANGLKHAFRRNDESGTTDVFVSLLNLPSITQGESTVPFCNVGTKGPAYNTPLAVPPVLKFAQGPADPNTPAMTQPGRFNSILPNSTIGLVASSSPSIVLRTFGPNWPDFQDLDVVRRWCDGTGLAGTNSENVCEARGDLGLVLSIWDAPATDGFSSTLCSNGTFFRFGAINVQQCSGVSTCYDICPDGTAATDSGECEAPALDNGDPRCLNFRGNYDPVDTGNVTVDGRVYNLHVRTETSPGSGVFAYAQAPRASGLPSPIKATISVNMVGAYYRIHQANSFASQGGSAVTCQQPSATQQIGCLVQGSPCSIGYAGREGKTVAVNGIQNAVGIKVDGVDSEVQCIQNLIATSFWPAVGALYPMSRRLYLNTEKGWENVTAGSDEAKMATCWSKRSTMDTFVSSRNFVQLNTPGGGATRQTYCEDFNEGSAADADPSVPAAQGCTTSNHNRCLDHTDGTLPWHNCEEKTDPSTCH
jgi:ABC-type phosphate transport system substrate-binding protein